MIAWEYRVLGYGAEWAEWFPVVPELAEMTASDVAWMHKRGAWEMRQSGNTRRPGSNPGGAMIAND